MKVSALRPQGKKHRIFYRDGAFFQIDEIRRSSVYYFEIRRGIISKQYFSGSTVRTAVYELLDENSSVRFFDNMMTWGETKAFINSIEL